MNKAWFYKDVALWMLDNHKDTKNEGDDHYILVNTRTGYYPNAYDFQNPHTPIRIEHTRGSYVRKEFLGTIENFRLYTSMPLIKAFLYFCRQYDFNPLKVLEKDDFDGPHASCVYASRPNRPTGQIIAASSIAPRIAIDWTELDTYLNEEEY